MKLFTIGVPRLVDVRLNNSQLEGFAKKDDLRYFTKTICQIDYIHLLELAPTAEILNPYKKVKNGDWPLYEQQFLELMRARQIETTTPQLVACYAVKRSRIIASAGWWLNSSSSIGTMFKLNTFLKQTLT